MSPHPSSPDAPKAGASGYEFSPLYLSDSVSFSPGSTFLATAHHNRVIIRSTASLSIVRTWSITALATNHPGGGATSKRPQTLDHLQWSDDGLYVLAASRALGTVWVFALAQEGSGEDGEVVRIAAGPEGLERAEWAKGGREVLCWSEHGLRLTVHEPSTGTSRVIDNPSVAAHGHTYSADGRYMALLERHDGKDHVGVYDTGAKFQLVRHFPLTTSNAQWIEWSPCGRFIAVAEEWLSLAVTIHSPMGPVVSTYAVDASAAASGSSKGEDPGLGVRQLAWAAGGQYLLLGGWDGRVRVIEAVSGACIEQTTVVGRVGKSTVVWQEPADWLKDTRGRGIIQFDRLNHAASLPISPASMNTDPPCVGVTHLVPSPSASHFAFVHATQPTVVHIHSLVPSPGASASTRSVAKVVLSSAVRDVVWGTKNGHEKLVMIGKQGAVYTWEREGWVDEEREDDEGGVAEGVGIPNAGANFAPSAVRFSADGCALVVQARRDICIMYDDADAEDAGGPVASTAQGPCGVAAEKEWETEGLSFVMEDEEEGEGEVDGDGSGEEGTGSAAAGGLRVSALKGRAWRPSDAYAGMMPGRVGVMG